jgi:glyoxylase-like metal-dependent hydrolase (beta-lactamase superfamily II)
MVDTLKLGNADLFRVEEAVNPMPLSFITDDEALIAANWSWLCPKYVGDDRECASIFQSWIVQVGGKVIVVDPCTGNGRNFPDFPPAHMLNTPYIERFEATGIKPTDVDYVFCTHLHMDHCGWNTELRGGKYVPTFPNAKYIMVQKEFDRWDPRRPGHVPIPQNVGTFENSVLPVLEAGLAEIVPANHRINDHFHVEPAFGHTAGHSLLRVETDVREVYFAGDAFHHVLEVHYPELHDKAAEAPEAEMETRLRILDACVEKNALLIPAHFPDPFGGTVSRHDGHYRFTPFHG